MKKRMISILLTLCFAVSLVACSSGGSSASQQAQEPAAEGSSEPKKEASAPEETEAAPADGSGSGEEPAEEAVPEDVLESYGLTAEEFAALKTSIQEHIDSEWSAEEAYLSLDNDSINDLWKACTIIRDDATADFMTDSQIESYIDGESLDYGSPLWKERAIILAHAINDWASEQSVDFDTYAHIWETLSSAFTGMMVADDTYLAPLFDLDSE